jgi:DNA-binding MurR/RpiR family transcriptional regulator
MSDGQRHSLRERLAAAGTLPPAEQRVGQFFVESGEEIAFLPAARIAETIGVSNATVVRTAQRLGYTGLPELRSEFQAAAVRRWRSPSDRVSRSLDEMSDDLPAHLLATQSSLLSAAAHAVRPAAFRRAVKVLGGSRRIVVYSDSAYAGIAAHFVQIVQQFGRNAVVIGSHVGRTAADLVNLESGDTLLALAFMHVRARDMIVLEHARGLRLPCVLVTDTLALALKGHYTVALAAPRGESDMFPTATVPLAILESLLLGIGNQDRARTLSTMKMRDELIRKLE